MFKYFVEGLKGDKKAFVCFDIFECTLCMAMLKMIPFFQPLYSGYSNIKKQITEPIDSLIIQCQGFLKCLPRPIAQLAGYPIAFYFLIAYLVQSFREFAELKENMEDLLQIHLILVGFVAATYILTYFISPGYFDTKEDKQEFERAIQTKQELKNNDRIFCQECMFPKVARSFHCAFCQKCIAKTEYHSSIFNKCIGAGNHPYYYLFILGLSTLFGLQFFFLTANRTISGKKIGLITLFFNFRIFIYYVLLLGQHTINIISNTTYKEIHEARKLPYMWKTLKGEFYNPFDKGICGNLREFLLVITTRKSVPFSQQELMKYQTIADEEKSVIVNKQDMRDSDSDEEEEEKKNDDDEKDEFESIGKDKPVPDRYINWLSKKFFTIIDIPNSPIREIAINEMKKKFRKQKQQTLGNNQFQIQQQLKISEQKMMRGEITKEELERQKNAYIEQMQKEREEYMRKQMEIQKKQYDQNPEQAKQAKLYMEMGMTNAKVQMLSSPQRAADIEADLKMAEKNYIFLFGQQAFDQFQANLLNPKQMEEQIQKEYMSQAQSQPVPQPVQQKPKHVYQPEQPNFMQQNYKIQE